MSKYRAIRRGDNFYVQESYDGSWQGPPGSHPYNGGWTDKQKCASSEEAISVASQLQQKHVYDTTEVVLWPTNEHANYPTRNYPARNDAALEFAMRLAQQ